MKIVKDGEESARAYTTTNLKILKSCRFVVEFWNSPSQVDPVFANGLFY